MMRVPVSVRFLGERTMAGIKEAARRGAKKLPGKFEETQGRSSTPQSTTSASQRSFRGTFFDIHRAEAAPRSRRSQKTRSDSNPRDPLQHLLRVNCPRFQNFEATSQSQFAIASARWSNTSRTRRRDGCTSSSLAREDKMNREGGRDCCLM